MYHFSSLWITATDLYLKDSLLNFLLWDGVWIAWLHEFDPSTLVTCSVPQTSETDTQNFVIKRTEKLWFIHEQIIKKRKDKKKKKKEREKPKKTKQKQKEKNRTVDK